jgi:hypothetical protein
MTHSISLPVPFTKECRLSPKLQDSGILHLLRHIREFLFDHLVVPMFLMQLWTNPRIHKLLFGMNIMPAPFSSPVDPARDTPRTQVLKSMERKVPRQCR